MYLIVLQVIKFSITVRIETFWFVALGMVLLIFMIIVWQKVLNNTDKVLERMKGERKEIENGA